MHTLYTPKLSTKKSSIPSGQQLRNVYKQFMSNSFKEGNVRPICWYLLFLSIQLQISPTIMMILSMENCEEMVDADVLPNIPLDYWLKGERWKNKVSSCMYGASLKQGDKVTSCNTPTWTIKGSTMQQCNGEGC